jgi:hypothetical protein
VSLRLDHEFIEFQETLCVDEPNGLVECSARDGWQSLLVEIAQSNDVDNRTAESIWATLNAYRTLSTLRAPGPVAMRALDFNWFLFGSHVNALLVAAMPAEFSLTD